MPVPSQGHYGFHSFPVVDWFCLFIYLWVLIFPLEDCSEFGNFVITLIVISDLNIWGLGLWCLASLSTIFQLYRGGPFYWWRKRRTKRKPPTCHKSLTNFITHTVTCVCDKVCQWLVCVIKFVSVTCVCDKVCQWLVCVIKFVSDLCVW
jgi:hypothetical protein